MKKQKNEVRIEGQTIAKCICITTPQDIPTYMITVLTTHQQTIDELLKEGLFVYRKRYRVKSSRTQPPIPLGYERYPKYNKHETKHSPNQPKCGYCSGAHNTKAYTNQKHPIKCSQCSKPSPTSLKTDPNQLQKHQAVYST